MSSQSVAKKEQGYGEQGPVCGNCQHYRSEMQLPAWMKRRNEEAAAAGKVPEFRAPGNSTEEKNKRCNLGGFAVKKTAWCMRWSSPPKS